MKGYMLIAGCSHTAGSEIDGSADSIYNRQRSFGNLLARKLGYEPINVAISGYTNSAILRTVIEWFRLNYNNQKLFVLTSWTESSRIEAPFHRQTWHQTNNQYADWFCMSSNNYLQINVGWKGYNEEEKDIQDDYQRFVVNNTNFLEILSANYTLQLQYFLKLRGVDYLMCNASNMFTLPSVHLEPYINNIDTKHYVNWNKTEESFWHKYNDLGYVNEKAYWGHHGEEPHALYSELLYNHIVQNNLITGE